MPRNMLINFPQLLGDVNAVVLVTELTLASARDAIRIISWLKSHASHAKIIVVCNKFQPGTAEISKSDFEASIETKIDVTIPYDAKAAAQAAKLGQTFAEANRTTKAAGAIRELADVIIGSSEGGESGGESAGKKSLLGNFDLKAMLPKKKAKSKAPAEQEAEAVEDVD
jgi:pilus assembly protein CpaE